MNTHCVGSYLQMLWMLDRQFRNSEWWGGGRRSGSLAGDASCCSRLITVLALHLVQKRLFSDQFLILFSSCQDPLLNPLPFMLCYLDHRLSANGQRDISLVTLVISVCRTWGDLPAWRSQLQELSWIVFLVDRHLRLWCASSVPFEYQALWWS